MNSDTYYIHYFVPRKYILVQQQLITNNNGQHATVGTIVISFKECWCSGTVHVQNHEHQQFK